MKKQLMRIVLKSIVLVGSILLICACNHDDSGTQKEGEYSILQGKKITFLTSQNKYINEYSLMAAVVKEKYGCDVEFQVVPDNEYTSFLKLKLATTEVPDVFEYNCPTQNRQIDAPQYCMDLSNEKWVSKLINSDVVKDLYNGKIYAMPKESFSGYMAVYYNKEVLESCGIGNPHPKTYLEFLDILETVKEKGKGVIPFYETNADPWTTQIFMTCGYPIALGDRDVETFQKLIKSEIKWTDVPEFVEILTQYKNLIKEGYVNEDYASAGYESAKKMIGTGKAAMYLTTELCASDIAANYPGCKLGAFVIPYADRDILPISKSVSGLFVPKDGGQVEVAKSFLEVWSLPEIQNIYFFKQASFTAFTDTEGGNILDCLQQLTDEYVATGNYIYQMNDQMSEYNTIFEELWKEYVLVASGKITPKGALENFQNIYEDYIEK